MTNTFQRSASSGLSSRLGASLRAGILVGAVAGASEGAWVALGIDSAVFIERAKALGIRRALASAHRATEDLSGALGCICASMLVYALLAIGFCLALTLLGQRWLRRRSAAEGYRLGVALGLGLWFGAELFWWTRPLLFSGLSMAHPKKLAMLALALGLGMALGVWLERLGRRTPRWCKASLVPLSLLCFAGGAVFLVRDTSASDSLGRVVEHTRTRPNVLIFIVDALRQDVLGCYGHPRVKTPHIDRLASEGVLFENAFVQAPFTWTSFGSFFTGKYPRRHGLLKMAPGVRLAENITLASWLKEAERKEGGLLSPTDYATAAFMTGTVSHGSGLLRGFDTYFEALVGHDLVDVHSQWSRFRSALLPWLVRNKLVQRFDQRVVANQASRWLKARSDKRFFSLVHYYSTHTPYDPQDEFREMYVDPAYKGPIHAFWAAHRELIERGEATLTAADAEQIRNLYYGGVSMADAMIGEVVGVLEQAGLLDETIVVVTSDHGEELGDHGLWEHNFMFNTNLRIPLIVRYPPRIAGGVRVAAAVDSIDLLPTLCDLLELGVPTDAAAGERGRVDGLSLLPLVSGEQSSLRPYSFAENGVYLSVQDGAWKLVVRRTMLERDDFASTLRQGAEADAGELYELARDPAETINCITLQPERAIELYQILKEWSQSLPIPEAAFEQSDRDIEDELVLKGLLQEMGYGGGVGEDGE